MVNPVLSMMFDLFLIGSAAVIIAGMVEEYLASRVASVGSPKGAFPVTRLPERPATHTTRSTRQTLHRVA